MPGKPPNSGKTTHSWVSIIPHEWVPMIPHEWVAKVPHEWVLEHVFRPLKNIVLTTKKQRTL